MSPQQAQGLIGRKVLVTVDNWFYGPNGRQYRAVFGTLNAIQNAEQVLGIKVSARSHDWYMTVGNTTIAGCQIHYAMLCDQVETGMVPDWTSSADKGYVAFERPSGIFCADELQATLEDQTASAPVSNLPTAKAIATAAVGSAFREGLYVGITCDKQGKPYAPILLKDKPAKLLDWEGAKQWAESLGEGAQLPNRVESALLFANLQEQFDKAWHWTSEQYSRNTAWYQGFDGGNQHYYGKAYEGRARAVRRFALNASVLQSLSEAAGGAA
jgi:hypothetical protein